MSTRQVREIISVIADEVLGVIGDDQRLVTRPMALSAAEAGSISFCSYEGDSATDAISRTLAGTVLVAPGVLRLAGDDRTYVVVANPRLAFLRLVARAFAPPVSVGVHRSASVDPRAQLHECVYVGANAVIGRCTIGRGSTINAGAILYDGVTIGERVTVHSGTIIGADGFGYARAEDGTMEKFIHIGGVVIEDDVEIGANSCIDRGTLGDTRIRRGAKIDNLVHIAHNVDVGEDAVVIAQSLIGGSSILGARAWIAPCACIRDGVKIGADATVGMGAVVTKDVPAGTVVMGAPARDASSYKQISSALSKLAAAS